MTTETKYKRGPVENIAYMIVKEDGSPAAYGDKLPIYWRPSVAERENERLFVGCTVVRVAIPKEAVFEPSDETIEAVGRAILNTAAMNGVGLDGVSDDGYPEKNAGLLARAAIAAIDRAK